MGEMVDAQVKGFIITTKDSVNRDVSFKFEESHYAEGVLRGLVHNGHTVTISEEMITVKREKSDYDRHGKIPMVCDSPVGYIR